ncbi:MAG: sugar ABC transporter permease, partial [Clostridia bacterium]|nr:sugar ABC transporter permease [Clostridia bacterium]
MKRYSDLEYLRLSKLQKFLYRLESFFCSIPVAVWHTIKKLGLAIWSFIKGIGLGIAEVVTTFKNGSKPTRLSYVIMGAGCFAHGQILRGILFLLFEIVFIFYMVTTGAYWLSMLPSLGKLGPTKDYNVILDVYTTHYHDNSFKILLYGVLTIFFIIAFIYTWWVNIRQSKTGEQILASGKKLKSGKDDLRSLVDDSFHKTLLALPMTGILVFTVMPIVFMMLVAFTNYD